MVRFPLWTIYTISLLSIKKHDWANIQGIICKATFGESENKFIKQFSPMGQALLLKLSYWAWGSSKKVKPLNFSDWGSSIDCYRLSVLKQCPLVCWSIGLWRRVFFSSWLSGGTACISNISCDIYVFFDNLL